MICIVFALYTNLLITIARPHQRSNRTKWSPHDFYHSDKKCHAF